MCESMWLGSRQMGVRNSTRVQTCRRRLATMTACLLGLVIWMSSGTATAQPGRPVLIATIKTERSSPPIRFSPDGKTLTIATGMLVGAGAPSPIGKVPDTLAPGGLTLWDVTTKKVRAQLENVGVDCTGIAFSPDGKYLAMLDRAGISLFEPASRKYRVFVPIADLDSSPVPEFAIAFSPNGSLLATGHSSGNVKIWDVTTGKLTATMRVKGMASDLVFFPDGKTLAAAAEAVYLWDLEGGEKPRSWAEHRFGAATLAISPDGKTLATPGDSKEVWLWDVQRGSIRQRLGVDYKMVEAVAYSRDGRILIAAGGSGNLPGLTLNPGIVTLWDTKTDKMLHSFRALDVTVRKVALSPDGKLLAVSPLDHLLKVNVWDISQLLPKESPTKK